MTPPACASPTFSVYRVARVEEKTNLLTLLFVYKQIPDFAVPFKENLSSCHYTAYWTWLLLCLPFPARQPQASRAAQPRLGAAPQTQPNALHPPAQTPVSMSTTLPRPHMAAKLRVCHLWASVDLFWFAFPTRGGDRPFQH